MVVENVSVGIITGYILSQGTYYQQSQVHDSMLICMTPTWICLSICASTPASILALFLASVSINAHFSPNRNVATVSEASEEFDEQAISTAVLELPPNHEESSMVSLES